jgi:hypothetical protein
VMAWAEYLAHELVLGAAVAGGVLCSMWRVWCRREALALGPGWGLPPVKEWDYKAEGKHNVVLVYSGDDDSWKGTALRLRKLHTGDATETVHEDHGLFPSTAEDFARSVMIPLLGSEFVDQCLVVPVSTSALELLDARLVQLVECRPVFRRSGMLDTEFGSVMLLTDGSKVDASRRIIQDALSFGTEVPMESLGPSVAVEIKPKSPALVDVRDAARVVPGRSERPATIDDASELARKGVMTKFRMQQVWKALKGKALRMAAYCPTMLHGDVLAKAVGVRCLIQTPHNNLRVFVDHSQSFPLTTRADRYSKEEREALASEGHVQDEIDAVTPREYELALEQTLARSALGLLVPSPLVVPVDCPQRTWHGLEVAKGAASRPLRGDSRSAVLLSILVKILDREPLLERLHNVQLLGDAVESSAVWEAYRPHLEHEAGLSLPTPSDAYRWAKDDSTVPAQRRAVRSFGEACRRSGADMAQRLLVAQAACDCSIMISLRLVRPKASASATGQQQGRIAVLPAESLPSILRDWHTVAPTAGHRIPQRPIGAVRLSECAAVLDELRAAGLCEGEVDLDEAWVLYRVSVVDMEPKLVSRLPKYAAKDVEITEAFQLFCAHTDDSDRPSLRAKAKQPTVFE